MARLNDFLRSEQGAVTIEFTALFPFFLFLLIFFADASMIYLTHSEMHNAARDIVRRMSTDQLTTVTEVETYAESKLLLGSREYDIQVEFGAEQIVVISVPMGEAAIFGIFFQPILGNTLAVVTRQRREPLA